MAPTCFSEPINDGYAKGSGPEKPTVRMAGSSIRKAATLIRTRPTGYDGYYVDINEYQYYFREGFRRGYEDGYYGRNQYGSYSNGKYAILGQVLSVILNLIQQ
jgi:hypothetical protein